MFFAVVACPQCRRVQVVDGISARAQCRLCDHGFELAGRKKLYLGQDPEQARMVAAKAMLQQGGVPIEALAEAVTALERERSGSLDDVIERLQKVPEFGAADVEDELLRAKLTTTAARVVEGLRQSNRVYEPRPGRYRWIG